MLAKTVASAAFLAAVFSGMSAAQDWSLDPTYGTATLNAGFLPDPYGVDVVAGGDIDAGGVGCSGAIAQAPDVRLQWSGGRITIGVESGTDTTLVVNAPDGSWYCSDDVNGVNPALVMDMSGQYDIWVGTYGGGTAGATLYFTEY